MAAFYLTPAGEFTREILMRGLLAFDAGDAAGAIALLAPLRETAHRFGGSHAQRDGRLAGARVAGEAHVQRRGSRREPHALAHALDEQQCGDLSHALLHRLEADEVATEQPKRAAGGRPAE